MFECGGFARGARLGSLEKEISCSHVEEGIVSVYEMASFGGWETARAVDVEKACLAELFWLCKLSPGAWLRNHSLMGLGGPRISGAGRVRRVAADWNQGILCKNRFFFPLLFSETDFKLISM